MFLQKKEIEKKSKKINSNDIDKKKEIKNYKKEITLLNRKIKSIMNLKKISEDERSKLILYEEDKINSINNKILNKNIIKSEIVNNIILDNKVDIQYNILKENTNEITNIIHIADIHIRLNLYHNEYRKVFSKLYESLRKINDNVLIVICGDLLHTKNLLTPDCTLLTWEFLYNLSIIFPVIIIMGNHDKMLDTIKTDSITAILKDRPIDNIYYIKDSGIYRYNNILFGVSSYKDQYLISNHKINKILKEKNINNKFKKVCLYHGIVGDVIYNKENENLEEINEEDNYISSSKRLTLKSFGDYDYFLFGDIHKFQYLNKEKTAAYCGSLISQNFGECDDYHGYIYWNIINGTSEYIKIYNENSFNKINIDNLIDSSIDSKYIKLSENSITQLLKEGNLRIDYNILLKDKLNFLELNRQILNIYPNLKIIYKPILKEIDKLDTNILKDSINLNLSEDRIDELTRKYILDHYPNIDNNIDLIMKELKKLLSEEFDKKKEINYEIGNWKILHLEFDNYFGYGDKNIIDFKKYSQEDNEIVGIFGRNSIGKSSLIDIITLMLFDKIARNQTKFSETEIINKSKNIAIGYMVIEINNNLYLIKRRIYFRKTEKGEQTKLQLFKLILCDDDESNNIYIFNNISYIKEQIQDTKKSCQEEIIRLIGTYEHFMYTSVILQSNTQSFINMIPKEKKRLLSMCLKLDKFNYIKPQILATHSIYKDKQKELLKKKNNMMNISLEEIKNQYENKNKELDIINNNINNLKIKRTEKEIVNNSIQYYNISNIEEKIKLIEKLKDDIDINIDKNKIETRMNELINNKLSIGLVKDNRELLEEKKLELNKLNINNSNNFEEIRDKYENNINILLNKFSNYHNIDNDEFMYINNNLLEIKDDINFLLNFSKIKDLNKEINILEENIIKSNKIKIIDDEMIDLKNKLSIINNREQFLILKKEIEEYEINKERIIEKKILIEEINNINYELDKENNNKIELYNKVIILKKNIDEIYNIEKELEEIYIPKNIYDILYNLVSNNGLEIYLISEYLETINSSINNIIELYSDKKLELNIKNDEINLSITLDNQPIKMLGAMECFIIDLVLKITVATITEMPKSQILFIDEGISVLDKENLSNINNLFSFIKQYYTTTFIITHIEQVKDHINHIIQIKKINKHSYVSSFNFIKNKSLLDIDI
jgi:DNA repair exonuclease SbcCD ATPase subunit